MSESTSIDRLSIEITSNSTSAATSIDALAVSLGNLKQNGSVGVAVKNLNKLSSALRQFTNTSAVARTVGILAEAMGKMKEVGSIATIGNSVKKLGESLKTLDGVNVDDVAPKIRAIADAVQPLSEVRAGGLNTMINGLSKLDAVTDKLDDGTITRFAQRIEKLNTVMGPLSTKMTTIQAGLRGLNSKSRTAGDGVGNLGTKVNTTTLNLASMITVIQGAVSALMPLVRLLSDSVSAAIEWDGIAARFGRGFGGQAQEVHAWVQRLNEELNINTQQFMQYSSTYATMLTGFGVDLEDASKMALGYTELTYDIWAGYNDIYKSYADAADAVRSAIAGEVEPIRRAGFTIVESTLEQTAANYGLEISLEKATEAQKSYLRYLTLVDQANAQSLVGTYAKEMDTAEGVMRTFSQQLKSLTQAFGSLFLPILVKVMPYLQAFVELLTDAIHAVAAFFGITIQGIDWGDYSDGLGGLGDSADSTTDAVEGTTQALKDLKKATIGIDELNVISPPNDSGGSGSGGGAGGTGFDGLDVDSLWDESIFAGINNQVDAIKEKFKEWLPVIETIAGVLGALGLANFLRHIGDALGQMGLLEKSLATIAIATIEAVLVFKFADDYLESGDWKSFLGEAIATGLGTYLLYRTWGDKGLVLGLAVAIAAQLGAITVNLADGGVAMDDPQLWLQAAFTTALAGAAGGWMAYKGLIKVGTGKGVGLGLLAGISLSLAAITIGDISADGETTTANILTAIGSIAAAAGFGFTVGGPWGALIGAVVGLALNVGGAIIGVISKDTEKSMAEDLADRFGDVQLSVAEVKVLIERLLPEWTDDVIQAADLQTGVAQLSDKISSYLSTMAQFEWQVSVGIGLTEDEADEFRTTVANFIGSTQTWIKERGYALEVGLKATGASDFVIQTSAAITNAASGELERLGKQLQETVNAAYEDGLLDIDELKAIQNIRNDMMEIVEALKTSEIEAELSMLEMRWSGVDLTPDSFKTMTQEWADTLKNKVKPALEDTVRENLKTLEGNVAFAKMELAKNPGSDEAQQMLADAEVALQQYMDSNPLENLTLEANIEAVNFALNTLHDAFSKEIERVKKEGFLDYKDALEFTLNVRPAILTDDGAGDIYANVAIMVSDMQYILDDASESLSKEARKNLESMLESMKPTMADFEDIAAANRKAGETVTKSVREGLNDYNQLKALSGDVDGIHYLIGKGFSTDATFLNTLATAQNAGYQIDASVAEGLLNNLDYVKDEATGVVIGIRNTVTGEVTHMTPILEENMGILGVKLGDALGDKYKYVYDSTTGVLKSIVDSTTGNEVWVNSELKAAGETAGSSLSTGVLEGAESEMEADKKSWLDWAIWPWNWFKEKNEINSPSKLFERGGRYLVDGLKNGMGLTSIRDRLSSMWSTAKTWWDKNKGNLSAYTPSIGSIRDNLSSAWSTAKTWWSKNKGTLSTYTPSIGSIRNNLSSAWSSAKTWWSKYKGSLSYTPSIGNIQSKLSSAWTTAKNWWNRNVKLSIPSLSFKVSYTTSGLGTVKKSIVKALGLQGWPKISFAANGGIFDAGSLIWAGERGAEIVANAGGGKTGVMNVDQMQDAVYEGVYAAVTAAMRAGAGAAGGQAVNVYLDSKQITATVEQRQRERGASIMGTQVYSY